MSRHRPLAPTCISVIVEQDKLNHQVNRDTRVLFSLRQSVITAKGFSTLQTTAGIMITGVLTGSALHYLPELMDQADLKVTRYAASAEATHKETWDTYEEAKGEATAPRQESLRRGFSAANDLVASPMGRYCFDPNSSEISVQDCPIATSE